jgi:hypothetical protein
MMESREHSCSVCSTQKMKTICRNSKCVDITPTLRHDQRGLQSNSVFNPAEVARVALEQCCERLSKEMALVKDSRFSINRRPAKMKASEEIIALAGSDFTGVTDLVNRLETSWRQSHAKVRDPSSPFEQSLLLSIHRLFDFTG